MAIFVVLLQIHYNVILLCFCNFVNIIILSVAICVHVRLGCFYEGIEYSSGSVVSDRDPCRECVCQRGTVDCRVTQCPRTNCPNPIVPRGQCCPICDREFTIIAMNIISLTPSNHVNTMAFTNVLPSFLMLLDLHTKILVSHNGVPYSTVAALVLNRGI